MKRSRSIKLTSSEKVSMDREGRPTSRRGLKSFFLTKKKDTIILTGNKGKLTPRIIRLMISITATSLSC